ncbi:MAG TPA: S8 family peptidase [Cytophagaceae bacterium]|jgi:serine protease AprX|nr:S8 family peptidase [Cytophagaceae bacterium]
MVSISKNSFLFIALFFFSGLLSAQNKKYVVYFTDKNNTPYTISDPTTYLSSKAISRRQKQNITIAANDLPVTPAYIDSLALHGAQVYYSLKWMNAAVVLADSAQMVSINALPFVKKFYTLARKMTSKSHCQNNEVSQTKNNQASISYGNSYNQVHMLEVDEMHNDGFHGEGMLIALLDAGFDNANGVGYLNQLFTDNRVLATYDFVNKQVNVYNSSDTHGLEVLSTLAAYQPGQLVGTAYNASFVLLHTEDVSSETEIEEANWAKAAEYADSIGVDIISSSLGYTKFDSSTEHTHQEMNGHTTIAARAANSAASKGILVLCSAGNEGNSSWHTISTPADGDSVLAIGAVDVDGNYAYFSSVGPSADGRVKPDLAAMGENVTLGTTSGGFSINSGTSFSCPLTAGLAAGLWQVFPSLTNMQIADALRKSASQYLHPDIYLGYGIPSYIKAKEYINAIYFNMDVGISIFPNPIKEGNISFISDGKYFNQSVTVKMYDVTGRQVAEDNVIVSNENNETNINAAVFPEGMYILRFYFSDKILQKKMVKY